MNIKAHTIRPSFVLCATGHRPDKLGGYHPQVDDRLRATARMHLQKIDPDIVISGMALGWDMAVAEAAISLGKPFLAAVPFIGQQGAWPYESQRRYNDLLNKAQQIQVVCAGGYAAWKMQRRNEFMVDNSHAVLALWNGTPGGTANCVDYANRCRKPVHNVWSDFHHG